MEHLENITKFIESSTYPVLGKQLQSLLLKKQDEFLTQEIESKLNEALLPYLKELKHDITFNVSLKKNGKVSVLLPEIEMDSEDEEDDELYFPGETIPRSEEKLDIRDDIIELSDMMRVDEELIIKGIVPIKPQYHYYIERILNIPIKDLDDIPVDVELDERIYDDAIVTRVDNGYNCRITNYYIQLKWPLNSALGRDIKAMLKSKAHPLYPYFTLSYNESTACFQIKLFKYDPSK